MHTDAKGNRLQPHKIAERVSVAAKCAQIAKELGTANKPSQKAVLRAIASRAKKEGKTL